MTTGYYTSDVNFSVELRHGGWVMRVRMPNDVLLAPREVEEAPISALSAVQAWRAANQRKFAERA